MWLDGLAAKAVPTSAPRVWAEDIRIQAGIGRFFAAKFRSGVLWAIYEKTSDRSALEESLTQYKAARSAWATFAERAKSVYLPDVPFGYEYQQRGHWIDRLVQIDEDIAKMEQKLVDAKPNGSATAAIAAVLNPVARPQWNCRHTQPGRFRPGSAVGLTLAVEGKAPASATLHYRHVNQVERFVTIPMTGNPFGATIPADFTKSPYPLMYYFSLEGRSMFPGIAANLANQPYFVLRQA
jgi:hypothetical protein